MGVGTGSARTALALAALADGSVYLLPSMKLARGCRELLRAAVRRPDAILFVAPCPTFDRLRDLPADTAWAVDHAFWGEVIGWDFSPVDQLRQLFPGGEIADEAWT